MRKRKYQNTYLEFHNSYIIVALGFILTGNYLKLLIFTSLILVHELGHFLTATILKVKVKKIVIYPYGGITKLDTIINLEIEKELLIALSGIIFQYLYYLLIIYLHHLYIIREDTLTLYTLYNREMIFFNLIPIYPLDGSKILNLLLSKIFPLNISNWITIIISFINILLLITLNIYQLNYSNIMIYLLLLTYLYKFYQKRKYLYHRFLLERYLYKINFKQIKIIKNYHFMYKNRTHLLIENNHYIQEKDFLKKIFT